MIAIVPKRQPPLPPSNIRNVFAQKQLLHLNAPSKSPMPLRGAADLQTQGFPDSMLACLKNNHDGHSAERTRVSPPPNDRNNPKFIVSALESKCRVRRLSQIPSADTLVRNHRSTTSKCFDWCRLGINRPFFLSVSHEAIDPAKYVPRSIKTSVQSSSVVNEIRWSQSAHKSA